MTLRYFDGCPSWRTTLGRFEAVADDLDMDDFEVTLERIELQADAERLRFHGSPTILVDGRDPFEEQTADGYGLSCRIYWTPEGPADSPTSDDLREVLTAYVDGAALI